MDVVGVGFRLEDDATDDVLDNAVDTLDARAATVGRAVGDPVWQVVAAPRPAGESLRVDVRPGVVDAGAASHVTEEGVVADPDAVPVEAGDEHVRDRAVPAVREDDARRRVGAVAVHREVRYLDVLGARGAHADARVVRVGHAQSGGPAAPPQAHAAVESHRRREVESPRLEDDLAAPVERAHRGLDHRVGGVAGRQHLAVDPTRDSYSSPRLYTS